METFGTRHEGTIVIDCGLLLDATERDPLPNAAVLVRRGRIAWTGHSADLARSEREDAELIDARDHTVMPGLIDCHEHLVYPRHYRGQDLRLKHSIEFTALRAGRVARILIHSGYTTVRDCGTQGNVAAAVRDAVRLGLQEGPRIIASGPIVTSIGGLGDPYHAWITNPHSSAVTISGADQIVRAVREQIKAGADNIKLGASGGEVSAFSSSLLPALTYEEMAAAVTEAHRLGRRVAAHAQATVSIKEALRAGVDTIEHGTHMDEEGRELFKRSHAALVPTISTMMGFIELGEPAGVPPHVLQEIEDNREPWLNAIRMVREAGLPVAAGADLGNRYPQGDNAIEIQNLVQLCGFEPYEAIRSATSVAALAIGAADHVGSLEPGKLADLLVVRGNPLDGVGILRDRTTLVTVMKGGTRLAQDPLLAAFPEELPLSY